MAKTTQQNKKAAARRARPSAYDIAERVRLGEDAYAVKKQVGLKAWHQIVSDAHNKGYTIPGYLSNTPDELKPRLHSYLKTQATGLVDEAYKPQMKELDYEGKVAENLRTKRLDDARRYNEWAAQQQSLSAAAATTAQQNYQTFLTNQAATAKMNADQLAQCATAFDSNGISNGADSATLGTMKDQLGAQANAAQNNANAAASMAPIQEERGAAIRASLQGLYSNIRGAAEGDYNKTMTDLGGDRIKLTGERATAIIDNYTKLLDKEMDKASANQDFQGLMAQLNEKSAEAQQAHQEFVMGQKTTRRGQTISSRTTIQGQNKAAETATRGQTLSHQDRVADRRQRALDNRLNRVSSEAINAQKVASADRTNAQKVATANTKITAVIDTIADILRTQQRGPHGKPGSGYLWDANEKKWKLSRQVLINRGATSAQINAGLAHARGQLLTPQQKAAVGIVG